MVAKIGKNRIWLALFASVIARTVLAGAPLIAVLASGTVSGQDIRISEVMPNNGGIVSDEDGDPSDWIELHNTTGAPIDLQDWYLTDDLSDLALWRLPPALIPAKGFLVVFASGKNRANGEGELHTSFKVSSSGEDIALVRPDGSTVEDKIVLPALLEGASFGYAFGPAENPVLIGGVAPGQLAAPTPGGANGELGFIGFVETPVTTPARGFYDEAVQVSVASVTPGAVVRYTLDGSEPTEISPLFPSPLAVSQTTTLRVRSFLDGWRPSFSRTDTYIFVEDVVTESRATTTINRQVVTTGLDAGVLSASYQDSSGAVVSVQDALKSIPSLSITTDDANLFDPGIGIYVNAMESWERPASVEWIRPDGGDGFQINSGIRIRGGYSRNPQFAKHSFRLFFRNEYGGGSLDYDFFDDGGLTTFDKLDLRTTQAGSWAKDGDLYNTMLRDIAFRDSALAMGTVCTRSAWCHVYLNGRYWGMYMTEERPDENFGAEYFGGDKEDYDQVKIWRPYDNQPVGSGFWIEDPAPAGNLDAYRRLHAAAMEGFENDTEYFAVQGMDPSGRRDPNLERLVDVDNMIDFLLLIYYAAAVDNGITWWTGRDDLLNNLYGLYNRESPDGFKWIQHDGEISYDRTSRRYPTKLDRTGPFRARRLQEFKYFNPQTLHEKLAANAEYRLRFADRVYRHMRADGALVRARSEARLNARAAEIDRAIVAHSARWGSTRLDRDSWAIAVESQRGFLGRSGDRCDEVIGYLEADGLLPSTLPPSFSLEGGTVTVGAAVEIDAEGAGIYFTTDGSDPRGVGGAVAGVEYNGAVVIDQPVLLKARARSGTDWSALTEAIYLTKDIPLEITEVMYNAPGGNRHDFIEIHNPTEQPVPLRGYKIDNAVDLVLDGGFDVLDPGGYLVAVEDAAAFGALYAGAGIMVAGQFDGNLSDSGERIDLEFHDIDLVSFDYSDARDWPQAADGAGHSLVPRRSSVEDQEAGSLDYGGNWRASTYRHGSPGSADPLSTAAVVLNEVTADTGDTPGAPLASDGRIELFNTGGSTVSLAGWYLSDDLKNPNKWVIPTGTVAPAGGFVMFEGDDFHPGRAGGFDLDREGGAVVLSSPDGVVDAVRFKGQENGVSLGRFPDGEPGWVKTAPTPGAMNRASDAAVQISALVYHPLPPSGREMEYIQLANLSDAPQTLESEAGPYRIDGGVSYTFPPGSVIEVGGLLWLVAFDPADTVQLDSFCSMYGLDPDAEDFFGPYLGSLSNEGERVALESLHESGDVGKPAYWVVVDEIYYFDQLPWPGAADGTGYPLIRTGLRSWGVKTPADSDADGMADGWEQLHFGSLEQSSPDPDGDGQDSVAEFIAGSDPVDSSSLFAIDSLAGRTLEWNAVPGRIYSVYRSRDLDGPFRRIASGLRVGEFTDTGSLGAERGFYLIRAEFE